jgi:hypothetical protein
MSKRILQQQAGLTQIVVADPDRGVVARSSRPADVHRLVEEL